MAQSNYIGQLFHTSNTTVAGFQSGTVLRVTGGGYLEVVSIPKPVFNPGDRVYQKSKNRYGRIVRMTNVQGLSDGLPPKGQQFLIADNEPTVIKVAFESDLVLA